MSYAQMEAMLVQKITAMRASEDSVLRAFDQAKEGSPTIGLGSQYLRLQKQIDEIEQLLVAMDSDSVQHEMAMPALLPETALQFSAAV